MFLNAEFGVRHVHTNSLTLSFQTVLGLYEAQTIMKLTHTLVLLVTSNTHINEVPTPFTFSAVATGKQFNYPVTTTCTLSSSLSSQDLPLQFQFHAPIWIIALGLYYVTCMSLCLSLRIYVVYDLIFMQFGSYNIISGMG